MQKFNDEKGIESFIPEDSGGYKGSVPFIYNQEKLIFYPDTKGLYSLEPQLHRENVVSIDTIDPPLEAGIDCEGFSRCRFDFDIVGDKMKILTVCLLRWNSVIQKWFSDGALNLMKKEGIFESGGRITILEDNILGNIVFLKVSKFDGKSFTMNIYSILC